MDYAPPLISDIRGTPISTFGINDENIEVSTDLSGLYFILLSY